MAATAHRFRHSIALPTPYDADRLFGFLASRAIPGVEAVERTAHDWRYTRSARLPGGAACIQLRTDGDRVYVTGLLSDPTDRADAVQAATRILDVATDPRLVDQDLSLDPLARQLVTTRPGLRVPGAADAHELVIRAAVGQQISVARAGALCGIITDEYGEPLPAELHLHDAVTHLFPTASALAVADTANLRMPRARGSAIIGFSARVADGALDLGADPEAVARDLLALPGFGPWTVGYVRMRALGDRDVLLDGDLIIRRSAEALGLPGKPRELAAYAERFAPWRSYLNMHLWAAYHP